MRTASSLTRRAALWLFSAPVLLPLAPSALNAALPPTPDPNSGVVTQSGLRYIDFRRGKGPSPRFGQLITFHYTGYVLKEGEEGPLKMFDSSYERNAAYFTKHGNGFTCQGIEEALHSMGVGGLRRVVLPPALGFTADKGPLPPGPRQRDRLFDAVGNSQPIVYDLELVSVFDDLLDRGDCESRGRRSNATAATLYRSVACHAYLPAPARIARPPAWQH